LPHTSKKAKRDVSSKRSNRLTYIVVAVIIIIAASAGWYAFSSFKSTAATNTTTSSSSGPVYAIINTTQGVIEAQLFPSVAPKTVANFVNLANSGFYNNLVWHRIVAGFVIQTGDPNTRNGGGNQSTWGTGGSNTTVPLETNSADVAAGYVNNVGYLGMARLGSSTNSGTSQFYINLADNPSLNGQYTVFGKVISGMNVALTIGSLPVNSNSQPITPSHAMVLSITIKNTP